MAVSPSSLQMIHAQVLQILARMLLYFALGEKASLVWQGNAYPLGGKGILSNQGRASGMNKVHKVTNSGMEERCEAQMAGTWSMISLLCTKTARAMGWMFVSSQISSPNPPVSFY